jgi:hypothetical protein
MRGAEAQSEGLDIDDRIANNRAHDEQGGLISASPSGENSDLPIDFGSKAGSRFLGDGRMS